MTKQNVINIIVNDKRYLSICKKITSTQTHLANDLYQETMLSILEIKDDRLNKAHDEGYLEVFIVGIANNIWSRRKYAKKHFDGKTSVFFEAANDLDIAKIDLIDEDYNFELDQKEQSMISIIRKDYNSEKNSERHKARVFNYSYNNIANVEQVDIDIKNPRQFAEWSKIPYSAVWKVCQEYKRTLKKRLK